MSWFKNAFVIDPPGQATPTDLQQGIVDRVCMEIARRHLSTPAILFLEAFRPMNYLGAQVLHYFQPIVSVILNGEEYQHFTEFLERRGSIDYFCERIELFDEQYSRRKKKKKIARK